MKKNIYRINEETGRREEGYGGPLLTRMHKDDIEWLLQHLEDNEFQWVETEYVAQDLLPVSKAEDKSMLIMHIIWSRASTEVEHSAFGGILYRKVEQILSSGEGAA